MAISAEEGRPGDVRGHFTTGWNAHQWTLPGHPGASVGKNVVAQFLPVPRKRSLRVYHLIPFPPGL
eukprot:1827574-Rhodomonas_salina.1